MRTWTKDWIDAILTIRPFRCAQRRKKSLRHVEGAVEVHRKRVGPVFGDGGRVAGKRIAPDDAGIVHQDRNLARRLGDFRRDGAAIAGLGDIERETFGAAAFVADRARRLGRRFGVDVEENEPRTFARIALRDGAADARARSGDDGKVFVEKPGHLFGPHGDWRGSVNPIDHKGNLPAAAVRGPNYLAIEARGLYVCG